MQRSTDRILVSHAGTLERSPALRALVQAKARGETVDEAALQEAIRAGVSHNVRKQIEVGIDVINDGEVSKSSFTNYARERLGGIEERKAPPEDALARIYGRDAAEFPDYFAGRGNLGGTEAICVAPLKYVGHDSVRADIETFKTALSGVEYLEAFLPAVAPGTIEHWLKNEHASDEEYLDAIAAAMHVEYKAIVDAGFVLQIDDPDLADGWQIQSQMSVEEYRRFAALRIEALNHALEGIPEDRVRFHMCWGSYHGPHKYDLPLRDIVDLVLKVEAEVYSIEASNPRHDHEWQLWQDVKLPAGKSLMPGVIGHATDFIEHPELVAQRLTQYAEVVGRENVIAGTDCGIGSRVGSPGIAWAKFEALAEGAKLATNRLWRR